MHELQFSDAARPIPVVVLKLPLCQYSLGHELLLLQRRNALLLLPQEDFNQLPFANQIHAIREAVWTCCNTWAENQRQPLTITKLKIWDWRIRKTTPEGYALAIAEFRNYLAAGRSLPPTPDPLDAAIAAGEAAPEPGGRALGSPILAGLINFVKPFGVQGSRFDGSTVQSSILDTGYAYAAWLYFTEMESQGRFQIENQKESEVRMEVAKAKADALAEEEAGKDVEHPTSNIQHPTSNDGNIGLATPPPDLTDDQPSTINPGGENA